MARLELTAQEGSLGVVVETREALNYSLMHNRIPLVISITVTHQGTEQSQPLPLSIDLEPLGPDLDLTAAPLQVTIPALEPGQTYSATQRELRWALNLNVLMNLDAAAQTVLTLRVRSCDENHDDAGTATSGYVTALPADQWWAEGIRESLAAFIRPQSQAISTLLDETSTALEHYTGTAALAGYQAGPGRVCQVVRGIYHVLSGLDLNHISSAESLLAGGHRIRPPAEVLDGRSASTVELATVFAAALERAGIHSVLAVSARHVLLGWLVEPQRLPSTVVDSPSLIATIADSQLFETVEITGLCGGERAMSFDEAIEHAERWWASYEREDMFLLDVHAAQQHISPLPTLQWDGETRVVEVVQDPGRAQADPVVKSSEGSQTSTQETTAAAPARMENWRRSLLDLSYRNPLLRLSRTTSAELHVPADALSLLTELVSSGISLSIDEHSDLDELHKAQGARTAADVDTDILTDILRHDQRLFAVLGFTEFIRRLRSLQRRARTTTEETGANPLYLAAGLLSWEEVGPRGGRSRGGHAPLILIPVTLTGGRGQTPFRIVLDETRDSVVNISLVEKLRAERGITLTPLTQPAIRDGRVDIAAVVEELRRLLLDQDMENFQVQETAHLALAQFSTLDLWRDLSENWQHFMGRSHVSHLVEHPGETYQDGVDTPERNPLAEITMRLPAPADGSQMEAVRWAAAGKSFILEGPPGTGKSQTITNLIAECLHQGKRVLFVAEKQAALDVVQNRLEDAGLGAFALDVHGRHQSLTAVREQIQTALTASAAFPAPWDAVHSRVRTSTQQLSRYPRQLHDPGPTGLSTWTAHELDLQLSPGAQDEHTADLTISRETLLGLGELSSTYDDAAELDRGLIDLSIEPAAHPWSLARLRTQNWEPEQIAAAAAEVLDAQAELPDSPATDLLNLALTPAQTDAVTAWLGAVVPGFAQSVLSLDTAELQRRSLDIDGRFWPFGKRRRKQRLLEEISRHVTDRSAIAIDQLSEHLGRLDQLRRAWDILRALFKDSDYAAGAEQVTSALFNDGALPRLPLAECHRLASAWTRLTTLLDADEGSILRWVRGVTGGNAEGVQPSRAEALRVCQAAWRRDIDHAALIELGRWVQVSGPLESLASRGLHQATEAVMTSALPPGEIELTLRQALTKAGLDERMHTTGLYRFDQLRYQRLIEQFTASAGQRRILLRQQLPAELIEAREFSPQAGMGAVAQLQQQVGRRRGGLRIRQLFERYGELITAAAPCLLMGPDSVARFLPADAVEFDVVVFDEASQIRVPEAIGAMGRGKSVVIVGDTKQMPPTAVFAHSSSEEDAEDPLVPADLDSILSEAHESGLPRLWLSWHYRSRDESLIAFSNQQYYQGRLATFPGPPDAGRDQAVQLRVVEGTWEGGRSGARINRGEAEQVLLEVLALLEEDPNRSIGVVTFNVQQRDLLLDMLETSDESLIQSALARDEEPLFVKNLENVQGDERDAIIFTLAFSRDEGGRVPLQWGSMTAAGGERRLNVAITRARQTVRIISSFQPHELDLRNSTSQGLADLKEYLLAAGRSARSVGSAPETTDMPASNHADQVHHRLLDAGLEVIANLGLSQFHIDFAVRAEGQPWIAVLLDGPDWAARTSVGDRDALPQAILTHAMGWPTVERLWLPEWLRDPDAVIDRIRTAAQQATAPRNDTESQHDAAPAPAAPVAAAEPNGTEEPEEDDEPTVDQRHVEQVPYDELAEMIIRTLRQAYRAPEEEILRSVARLYGHQRMGTRIQQRLDEVFQQALAEGRISSVNDDEYAAKDA